MKISLPKKKKKKKRKRKKILSSSSNKNYFILIIIIIFSLSILVYMYMLSSMKSDDTLFTYLAFKTVNKAANKEDKIPYKYALLISK